MRITPLDLRNHEFSRRFVEETSKLRQGPDRAHNVDMGSMVNRMRFEKVCSQVDDAVKAGAKVLVGGEGRKGEGEKGGYYFQPTVITDSSAPSVCMPDPKVRSHGMKMALLILQIGVLATLTH